VSTKKKKAEFQHGRWPRACMTHDDGVTVTSHAC
jgi:hypothetical protein